MFLIRNLWVSLKHWTFSTGRHQGFWVVGFFQLLGFSERGQSRNSMVLSDYLVLEMLILAKNMMSS
jgi:hypothetical protein